MPGDAKRHRFGLCPKFRRCVRGGSGYGRKEGYMHGVDMFSYWAGQTEATIDMLDSVLKMFAENNKSYSKVVEKTVMTLSDTIGALEKVTMSFGKTANSMGELLSEIDKSNSDVAASLMAIVGKLRASYSELQKVLSENKQKEEETLKRQ
jgi:hypothetical protein